ncbi:hypothetical protein MKW92_024533 [Papaver armeniacum]|nr:hypothetical protein MKW92_024533 [Papaver armeniacum]
MNSETTQVVRQISKCTIKPHKVSEESKQPHYLTPWDLSFFNAHYIQQGLLFRKPAPSLEDPNPTITFIDRLKQSLSITLTHFYPLSGRMVTKKQDNPPFYGIYVDCSSDSLGAEFIHAAADITMLDILTPIDVPRILLDGIFVGCIFNHVIGDGTSYWKFFHAFAEISRRLRRASKGEEGDKNIDCNISPPPITKRWFMGRDGDSILINLGFSHHKDFIDRYEPPLLRERMFHFTAESLVKLKAKANEECNTKTTQISCFQALSAHVWRSITRARHHHPDGKTVCKLAISDRLRLNPPSSENYFGNCVQTVCATTTIGELLHHSIGWAALILHEAIKEHTDEKIRGLMRPIFDSVRMGSSPRFDVYDCDFGLGMAVAARSGFTNKFDGKVTSYRGLTGRGSVMLEVCLAPESMSELESDAEFMDAVSPHAIHSEHLACV